jgi:hypothetical protein
MTNDDPTTFAGCDPLDPQRTPGVRTSSPDNPMDPADLLRADSQWEGFCEHVKRDKAQECWGHPDHPAGTMHKVARRADGQARGEPPIRVGLWVITRIEK